MPDFRSLISRIADELDHYRQLLMDDRRETHALAVEARAALAESDGPAVPDGREPASVNTEPSGPIPADDEMTKLATAEMVRQLRTKAATEKTNRCHYSATLLTRAADLLAQRQPQPVPVSERLPGPGDCDGEGRCWLLTVEDEYPQWRLHSIQGAQPGGAMIWVPVDSSPGVMVDCFYTSHWLPAHALPLPQPH